MEPKINFNKKYTTISIYAILTFAVCLMLVVFVDKFSIFVKFVKEITHVLAPVIWGIVLAYLVNPVMCSTEKLLHKYIKNNKKLVRVISVTVSLVLLLFIITTLLSLLLPQVIDSIMGILNNFSTYLTDLENRMYIFFEDYPNAIEWIEIQFDKFQPQVIDYVNNLLPNITNIVLKLKDGAIVILITLKDFLIGFIVAVYLLYSKETFIAQMKKTIIAIFPDMVAKGILEIASHSNKTLSGFISGKILDSFIIGVLAFICMTIMKFDFVVLMSVVIGVTNVIPFFGPFFGAIPCALLLIVASPSQVIPFVIFVLVLQQFDGNILGPKILGDSTGISAFWVMFAIFIGGGLFGFAGMLLGVPVFAVIYTLIRDLVHYLLKGKGLSTESSDYMRVEEEIIVGEKVHVNYFEKILKKNPIKEKIEKKKE